MKLKSQQVNDGNEPIYLKDTAAILESYNGQYVIKGKFSEDVYDEGANFEFFDCDANEYLIVNGYNFEVELV